MIDIDGAAGEGGGQILRSALSLSLCTGQAFSLQRIRAGRPKPGLMRQHLSCVQAAATLSGATVHGAEPGSQTLRFSPGPLRPGDYAFSVGTAGSCCLLLQTLWPALLQAPAPSRLRLGGGTHNPMAPPFHFLARSYAPLLQRLGARAELSLQRPGFYPAGGGQFEATIWPVDGLLQPFDLLTRGACLEAYAECWAPALPRSVARRELTSLGAGLGWQGTQLREQCSPLHSAPGNALLATLVHEELCLVFSQIGTRGISAEKVAADLAQQVRAYQRSEAALEPHLADQWALPLALAVWQSGRAAAYTCSELNGHARTHFGLIEQFLPLRFGAAEGPGGWTVRVQPA